ncbi:LamG-like jellyroll fold domain-containing protein [Terasakiella pusilla]|uniref:LamG-like jellyroll fold domain-containing protein n=1 Tax=Terasakiella pusilla TaxID=64973 RepID=UPI003AA8AE64
MNFFDRGNGQSDDTRTVDFVWTKDNSEVVLPPDFKVSNVQFDRAGPDLLVQSADGQTHLIENYFAAEKTPSVGFADNVILPADIIEKLAGPLAPQQIAQQGELTSPEPIGTVETAQGGVSAIRADGSRVELQTGDPVYQGDELVTDANGAVGIVFADDTTFALGEDGRMILDEMVYDPAGSDGAVGLTLLSGAMTFVSGAVAKVNPDAMQINTPVATIGIRGTGGIVKDGSVALIGEGNGQVGEISVTAPNGDVITLNQENQLVTSSAGGLSPITIADPATLAALGGAAVAIMAAAGLISDAIASAAKQAQDKIDQNNDEQAQDQVDQDSAEGVEFTDVLSALGEGLQKASFDISNFLKGLQSEIEDAQENRVRAAVEEENQYAEAESILKQALATANSASTTASDAENKVLNATDENAAANQLAGIGVTDTAAVIDVVYAGYDAFGSALALSAAASAVAELANAALYTTGEGITGDELVRVAQEIQAAADAALQAAEQIDLVIDAIISAATDMMNDIVANHASILANDGGNDLDLALQNYAATDDDVLVNNYLSAHGFTLSDVDTFLDGVLAAVGQAVSQILDIQTERDDTGFLSGFKDVLNEAVSFIVNADGVTGTAENALISDIVNTVTGDASSARTSGLDFEQLLTNFKNAALSTYKNAQIGNVDASVADSIASGEAQNSETQNKLGTTTSTYKATSNSGAAAEDYMSGKTEQKLYGADWDSGVTDNKTVLADGDNADKTDGSEGAVASTQTDYVTEKGDLSTATSNLQTASANVLQPMIEWAKAEAKLDVLTTRTGNALDKVQEYALDEIEVASENFIDMMEFTVDALEESLTQAQNKLTGTAPASLDAADSKLGELKTALSNLSDSIDGISAYEENAADNPTQAQLQQMVDDALSVGNLIEQVKAALTAASADLTGEAAAKGYVDSLILAVGSIETAYDTALVQLDQAIDFDTRGADDLSVGDSATILTASVGEINEAIAAINTAMNDVASAMQSLSDRHPSDTVLAQNAQDVSTQADNAKSLNDFAKSLTDLWEDAFNTANGERETAKTDFTAKETAYNNALDAEEAARVALVGDNATTGALKEFQNASSAKYQADKDFAYDNAYLDAGRAVAEQRAESFVKTEETKVDEALTKALAAIEAAKAASTAAKAASTDSNNDPAVTAQAQIDAAAARDDALAAVSDAQAAIARVKEMRDDPSAFNNLGKASPADIAERYTALESKFAALKSIAAVNGQTYTEIDGTTQTFGSDGTVEKYVKAVDAYDTLADLRAGGANSTDITNAETDATTAETQVASAEVADAFERATASENEAISAVKTASTNSDTADETNAAAQTLDGNNVEIVPENIQSQVQNIVDQIAAERLTLQGHKDAATNAKNSIDLGTSTPTEANSAAVSADTAAGQAQTVADNIVSLSKQASNILVAWAVAEVSRQLALAQAAEAAAASANATLETAYDQINTNYSTQNVTQGAVDDVTGHVGTTIRPQAAIVEAESAKAKAAYEAADAALEIARKGSGDYNDFAVDLQKAAEEVGDAREASSAAENTSESAQANLATAELRQTYMETLLQARQDREQAEADAQAAADQAAQDTQNALDQQETDQANADEKAAQLASDQAEIAQQKAALADQYAQAAEQAAIRADAVEADAQYKLAREAAQDAQAAANSAAELAAGHGSAALNHATAASASAAEAEASLAVALSAKENASSSASAADKWRSGAAATAVDDANDDVDAVSGANGLVARANLNAQNAINAVNEAKFGNGTDKPGAIQLQVDAAAAKAAWDSKTQSEASSVDRLVNEMAKEGIVNSGTSNAYTTAEIAALDSAGLDGLDLTAAGAKEIVLRIWVNALKSAMTATENAEAAYDTAQEAMNDALSELTIAENEAVAALKAAVNAAAQVADLVATAAAADSTQTLGRLAADLQAESSADDALETTKSAQAALDSDASDTDATDIINAQGEILSNLATVTSGTVTQGDVTAATNAYNAASAALAKALIAKNQADAAVAKLQDIDGAGPGTMSAIEQFYVDVSGLPGTPSIGTLDNYDVNVHDWVYVDGTTHVIHVDSISKYQSVKSNIELAEKQAQQIGKTYDVLETKVSTAEQNLQSVLDAKREADLIANNDLQNVKDDYPEAVERAEASTEKSVDSAYAAVKSTKSALDGVIDLVEGSSVDGSNVVTVSGDSALGTTLTTDLQQLVATLDAAAQLSTAVDGWSTNDNDPTNPSDAAIQDVLSDIGNVINALDTTIQNLTDLLADLTDGTYADDAAILALDAAQHARNAMAEAQSATTNLQTLRGNQADLNAATTVEDALAELEPANAAAADAKTAAQEAGQAADSASKVADIQETQSQESADAASQAARQADYDAVILARDNAANVSTDARDDANAAKAAYDNAVADLTTATTQAGNAQTAATFSGGAISDQEVKEQIDEANSAAQRALGSDANNADSLNLTNEVAKAKAAWLAASNAADAAESAYSKIQAAAVNAKTALDGGQSVSQYRQTAETNYKTLTDKNKLADTERQNAEKAETDAQTAADRVEAQSQTAVDNRAVYNVSDSVANLSENAEDQVDAAQAALTNLKTARTNTLAQAEIVATNAESAATKAANVIDEAGASALDVSSELGAAQTAQGQVATYAQSAKSNLDTLKAAYDQAVSDRDDAQTIVDNAGSTANDFAKEELALAKAAVSDLYALLQEATKINEEAQSALQQANESVDTIAEIGGTLADVQAEGADTKAQVIAAYEAQADASAQTAQQLATRAQELSDEVSSGGQGLYHDAKTLAAQVDANIQSWLDDTGLQNALQTDLGATAYNDLIASVQALQDKVDNTANNLNAQLDDALSEIPGALSAATNAAQQAQVLAGLTHTEIADARTTAQAAADQAKLAENNKESIEGKRSLIQGLYDSVQAIETDFSNYKAEAEQQIDLNTAEALALATPEAYDDTITGVQEDGSEVIDVFAANGGQADGRDDGGAIQLENVSDPDHGTLKILKAGDAGYDPAKPWLMRYTPDPDFSGNDSFTYTITNGNGKFASATVSVTVDPTNDIPVAISDKASIANESSPVDVRVLLNDEDVDGDTVAIHSVIGDGNAGTAETDGSVEVYELDSNGNSTGKVLGTASWAAGSSLVRFTPAAGAFDYLAAGETESFTFKYVITDGTAQSTPADITITVTGENDAPTIEYSSPLNAGFVEDGGPVTVFNAATLNAYDVDGDTIESVVVQVNGFTPDDILTFTAQGGITGTYDSATGQLILSDSGSSATNADFNAVMKSIAFNNSSDSPDTSNRVITMKVNDGTLFSTEISETVSVQGVNDAPVVNDPATEPDLTTIQEDHIFNDGTSVSDLLAQLDVSDADGDAIGIALTSTPEIDGYWQYSTDNGGFWTSLPALNDSTAHLLAGTDLVRFVPYQDFHGQVSLQFRLWDGTAGSAGSSYDATTNGADTAFSAQVVTANLAVSSVNDAPELSYQAPMGVFYVENGAPATVFDNTYFDIIDADGETITSATVKISGHTPDDLLSFTPQNGITGTYNSLTGELILTDSGTAATNADFTAVIKSVQYSSSSEHQTGLLEISVQATDGTLLSNVVSESVIFQNMNDAPVVNDPAVQPNLNTIVEDDVSNMGTSVADLLAQLDVSDAEGDSLGIAIVDTPNANGIWEYSIDGGSSWTDMSGRTATDAKLLDQSGLVRFVPNPDYDGQPSMQFRLWDGTSGTHGQLGDASVAGGTSAFSSDILTANLTITPENDAAVINGANTAQSFTEDGGAIGVFDPALDVIDPDGDVIASATIVNNGFTPNDDLTFTPQNGVTGIYNPLTGTLVLSDSGTSATNADFAAVIRSVQFNNTSDTPDTTPRTLELVVNDGLVDSIPLAVSVNITATNDLPVFDGTPLDGVAQDSASNTITEAELLVGMTDAENDVLSVSSVIVLTPGSHTVTDMGGGVWELTPENGFTGNLQLQYTVSDGTGTTMVTRDVPVSSAPTDIMIDNMTVDENADGAIVGNLSAVDPDAGDTHTFTTTDPFFEIVNGNQLKLKDGFALDHESSEGTYDVDVVATDSDGLTFTKTIFLSVTDQNDPVEIDNQSFSRMNMDFKYLEADLVQSTAGPVTFEVVFEMESGSQAAQTLFTNGTVGTNGYSLVIQDNLGFKPELVIEGVGTLVFDQVEISSYTPTHIAVSYDGTTWSAYVDGQPVVLDGSGSGIDATAAPIVPTGATVMGAGDGLILDEVRVWDSARTEAEINGTLKQPLTGNEPNLVGLWGFEGNETSLVFDKATGDGAQDGVLHSSSNDMIVSSYTSDYSAGAYGDVIRFVSDGARANTENKLDFIQLHDPEMSFSDVTMTITVTNGTLTFDEGLASLTSVTGNGTSSLTIVGDYESISTGVFGGDLHFLATGPGQTAGQLTITVDDNHPTDPQTSSKTFEYTVDTYPDATITGTTQVDIMIGDKGDDTFTGAQGMDTLTGGQGQDVFVLSTQNDSYYISAGDNQIDHMMDFTDGEDTLRLDGADGYAYGEISFGDFADMDAAITAMSADPSADRIYFFTVAGDGYIHVKGAGTGTQDFNTTTVKFVGMTDPISLSSFESGVTPVNYAPQVLGVSTSAVGVDFDGDSSFIDAGRGMADNLQLVDDMTIETWLKLDSFTNTPTLMSFSGDTEAAADNTVYRLYVDATGDLHYMHEYGAGTDVDLSFDTNLPLNEWHHISMVRNHDGAGTSTVEVFIDGVSVGVQTYDGGSEAPAPASNATLRLGGLAENTDILDGSVADVRIWSEARTEQQVKDNYNRALDEPATEMTLQANWTFKDAIGEQEFVGDLSGNGNDLRVFDSLTFDGVDDYATLSDAQNISEHAASAWVRTDAGGTILYGTNGTDQEFSLAVNASGQLVVNVQGASTLMHYETTGYNLTDDRWHNIGYSVTMAGMLMLFIDGAEVPVGSITKVNDDMLTDFGLVTSEIGFGRSVAGADNYDGELSEVALYNQPLGAGDFATIYAQGVDGVSADTLGYWMMSDGEGAVITNDLYNAVFGDATIHNMTPGAESWNLNTPRLNVYADASLDLEAGAGINVGSITPSTGKFTISAWINPEDLYLTDQTIFSLGGTDVVLKLTSNGMIEFSLDNGAHVVSTEYWGSDGEWQNISVTYDPTTGMATIYFDGDEARSEYIGHYDTAMMTLAGNIGAGFDGDVGEVQFWNAALSHQQINDKVMGDVDPALESDLEAYWQMNEASGSSVVDQTGNGHDGTLSSGYSWNPALPKLLSNTLNLDEDTTAYSSLIANDLEGDTVSYALQGMPMYGSVELNPDGSFVFTPDENVFGADSFIVRVSDNQGNFVDHTVNVMVHEKNEDPYAGYDELEATQGESFLIDEAVLLGNDYDQDMDVLDIVSIQGAENGSLVDNGDGTWTYMSNAGFTGYEYLTYTVTDGNGGHDTGHVELKVKDNPEQLVNSTLAGDQSEPSIAALNDGGWITVWQDATTTDIYAQRYNFDGSTYGTEFKVNDDVGFGTGAQGLPSVTGLSDGGYVISWANGATATNPGTVIKQYDYMDMVVKGATVINAYSDQGAPQVIALNDGGYAVIDSEGASNGDVSLKTYSSIGVENINIAQVNGTAAGAQYQADIAEGTDGSLFVVYRDDQNINSYGQIYSSAGTLLQPDFQLGTTGVQNPKVAGLLDGNFAVVWQDVGSNGTDIYVRLFDPTNVPGAAAAVQVNTGDVGEQINPQITALSNGNFVVVWEGPDNLGDVFARIFNASGAPIGPEFMVHQTIANAQSFAGVTGLSDGSFLVTWTSDNGTDTDIYQKRFNPDGSIYGEFNTITGTTGVDTLNGTDGYDVINGFDGDDLIMSSIGQDTIDGGSGYDTIDYSASTQGVTVDLMMGMGDKGTDGYDSLMNIEAVHGSNFGDTVVGDYQDNFINGDGGDDTLFGGDGQDTLLGGAGNDDLYGDSGNDDLQGADGDDLIFGGLGADTITTGTGLDLIKYIDSNESNITDMDVITDFTSGSDIIHLQNGGHLSIHGDMGDLSVHGTLTDMIAYIEAAPTVATGVLVIFNDGVDTYLYAKVSAPEDSYNGFLVQVTGLTTLVAGDFNLTGDGSAEITLTGSAGADTLVGTASEEVLLGLDGDDTLIGDLGDDVLIGGQGTDVAVFANDPSAYKIGLEGAAVTVEDIASPAPSSDGKDMLIGVENMFFEVGGTVANQRTFTLSGLSEELVNDIQTGFQTTPDVAVLREGGYVIVYEGLNGSSDSAVYFRIYDETGAPGPEIELISNATYQTGSTRVASMEDGGFVVTWVEGTGANGNDVFVGVYDELGSPVANYPGPVNVGVINQAAEQHNITVAGLNDGGFVVTWTEDLDIKGRRFFYDGSDSGEFIVANSTDDEDGSEVVALDNGGFAVIWQSDDYTDVAYKMTIYDNTNTPVASNIVVEAQSIHDLSSRDITVLANGNILVVGVAEKTGDGNEDAVASIYDASGNVVASSIVLNAMDSDPEMAVTTAALSNGNFVAVWRAVGTDTDQGGLFAQIYDPSGVAIFADSFLVNSIVEGDQGSARVEATEDGFVVVWSGDDSDGLGIYKQEFNNDGTLSGGVTITGTADSDYLMGGDGTQVFVGQGGGDTFLGGVGDDTFVGAVGDDEYNGEDGVDLVDYSALTEGVNVDLLGNAATTATSGNDTLFAIEAVVGTDYDDNLIGDVADNTLVGGLGNDTLDGGAGNDTLLIGVGDDTAFGGAGDDTFVMDGGSNVIDGGTELDWITFDVDMGTEGITLDLSLTGNGFIDGTGDQTINTDFGVLDIANVENVEATIFDDTVTGDSANNTIYGLEGDDVIAGGAGNDVLVGGADADYLTGGLGADTFLFEHIGDVWSSSTDTNVADVITDFETTIDSLTFYKDGFDNLFNLADGPLAAINFETHSTAPVDGNIANAGPTFIFVDDGVTDANYTALYYDADGSGTDYQSTKIAEFSDDAVITKDDIILTSG